MLTNVGGGGGGAVMLGKLHMISEGSCDTEDWSNDAENSALPS